MTHCISGVRMAACLYGLALAGCSTTHVGESWQCPIAQGTECASVAAADPAVAQRTETPALRDPLYQRHGKAEETSCNADRGPFAWLARLFAAEPDDEGGAMARVGEDAAADAAGDCADTAPHGVSDPPLPRGSGATAPPARSGVDDGTTDPLPVAREREHDELREAEVIGRIWIAPFVDAAKSYREGHWVRAVLAPAGWRVP